MPEKLIIIGSGPAAWTAAIYAGRARLNPVVFEGALSQANQERGTLPLGQLALTTEVENFPGFPKGVQGPVLMEAMKAQAEHVEGVRVITDDIVSVDLSKRPFVVRALEGQVHETHALIIATGASANYLGLESEGKYKNAGVSACAVCDGALPRYRNKPLVVVGGGDSAAEEGTYLTKFASTVYLVHRRDTLRASKTMAERILNNPKVKPVWHSQVVEVIGNENDGMTGVRVRNVQTGAQSVIEAVGMFVAIGHTPNTAFLKEQIATDDKGYIRLADPWRTTTSVEGVFAAGDVADSTYRQAITAAGMGCKAALDAERWLAEKGVH